MSLSLYPPEDLILSLSLRKKNCDSNFESESLKKLRLKSFESESLKKRLKYEFIIDLNHLILDIHLIGYV